MKIVFSPSGMFGALLLALSTYIAGVGIVAAVEGIPQAEMEAGQGLFLVNCRQCHGTKGTAGTPLKNNHKLADSAYVATTILKGRGYMTAFAEHLDDKQIAAIATFVRNSWSNEYGRVTPDDVAAAR